MAVSVIEELRELAAAGASVAVLTDVAARALADPDVVSREVADTTAAIAGAVEGWEALEEVSRGAWRRFPGMHVSGAHGAAADPRAIQLFSTVTYLRNAGCYSGSELAAMAQTDSQTDWWIARESLRLRCLLVTVDALIAELTDGRVSAPAFAGLVGSLVGRLGRVTVR